MNNFFMNFMFLNKFSIYQAVGAEILSTFSNPERSSKILGRCDLIEEIMIGEDKMIKFSGCAAGF